MSKMPSHWSFGHLQPKLWAKEASGVKPAVWLSTTKSRESTSSQPPNWECKMSLERSRRGLQLWFRPRCDQTWQSGVMSSQSPGTPTGTVSGQFRDSNLGVPGKKSHLDVASAKRCREYYMGGRWWLPPSLGHGEFCGPKCPWLVPTPKGVPKCELTPVWLVLDADSSLIY
jgi:hypothetical protein